PRPVVRNREERAPFGGPGGDDDATARRRVAQRVVEQVCENLAQGVGVGGERGPIARRRDGDGEVDAALASTIGERRPGLAREGRDVYRLGGGVPAARLDAREVEEVGHEALQAACGARDGLRKRLALRSRGRLRRERLGV